MRPASLLALLLLVRLPSAHVQTAPDSSAIRQAALDYIEGWYAGDGDRMGRALHPEFVKRIMNRDTLGSLWIRGMGAIELVRGTRAGGGTQTPAARRRTDVRILDISRMRPVSASTPAAGSTICSWSAGAVSGLF